MTTNGTGGLPRLLRAAHAATARGWPVFPLVPGGKRPALAGWQNRASTDPDTLAAWWATAPYNIGIACGPAGLVVVDLDAGAGRRPPERWAGSAHGRDVLAILAGRAGVPEPADTYTVATPHGEHRYFTAPALQRLGNTAGRLGWRIDTRGAGGYVIAAGSLRRIGARVCRYRVTNPAALAPLPDWITTALAAPPPTPARVRLPTGQEHRSAYVRAAVAGEARNVVRAEPGTRNTTLFIAAARLGGLVAAGVLDETAAADALRHASRRHIGIEGFTAPEVDRTIGNGLRHGCRQPRPLC
jgi:hypothetical protein